MKIWNKIVEADLYLLDNVFQKFANKFQIATGKTCFALAKYCYFGMSLSCILIMAYFLEKREYIGSSIFVPICLFWINEAYGRHKDDKKFIERKDERSYLNFRRLYSWYRLGQWAIVSITLFPPSITPPYDIRNISTALYGITLILAIYFEACTPLPPCRGKVKEWIKSFLSIKRLSPVEVSSN